MKTRLMFAMSLLVLAWCDTVMAADDLAAGFRNPPTSARPWAYWFWINGNINKEGITADLEALKRVGIPGVLIMECGNSGPLSTGTMAPPGPYPFGSPQWRELFKFTVQECQRLGIEVNMNNDAGWCGSGGPWNTPEHSMQKVVWTETRVEGPRHFETVLSQPEAVENFYRDIALLAFPTPLLESVTMAAAKPIYTFSVGNDKVNAAKLTDGDPKNFITLPWSDEEMLLRVAIIYDKQLRVAIQRLLAFLEPALIITLGLMIAGIIVSILLAILSVNDLAF
jgi:hypothetical protein